MTDNNAKVVLYQGDCLTHLEQCEITANICITSPPYFQKFDYENSGQYGHEATVDEFIDVQVKVFHEVNRILVEGGTCFIVIGDTSNNYSPIRAKHQRKTGNNNWHSRRKLQKDYREKEILSVPLRLAEALRADSWVHRNTLIWDKGISGVMRNSDTAPECHEYILHLIKWSKNGRPYGNTNPLKSSILRHHTASDPEHGCVFPLSLVTELLSCVKREEDEPLTVVDPYIGSGTVALAAAPLGYTVHGFDLDCSVAAQRCHGAYDTTVIGSP